MRWLLICALLAGCSSDSAAPEAPPTPVPEATPAPTWTEANGLSPVTLGPDAPDIALVVIDTLRSDAPLMHLSQWAGEGRTFATAIAPSSWTLPSMAAILAGRELRANHKRVPDDWPLLPEVLKAAGYATHAVVANRVLAPDSGTPRGFDTYELTPLSWDAPEVLRRADAFLAQPKTGPRFLYLHLMEPHLPYTGAEAPPRTGWSAEPERTTGWPGWEERQECIELWRRQYDAEVQSVDKTLVDWLKRVDLDLVAVTSDHGEGLFQRTIDPVWQDKIRIRPGVGDCGAELLPGYPDHGLQRFDEAIRVPLYLRGRGVRSADWDPTGNLPPPWLEGRQVRVIDLARTLLKLAGGDVEGPTLPLTDAAPAAPFAMGVDKGGSFVRTDTHKLLREADGREALFDLKVFRGFQPETKPLDDASKRAELAEVLDRWFAADPTTAAAPGLQTTEALRALGYVE